MPGALVVVRPFGRYKIGAIVDDPAQIRLIMAGEHAHKIVRLGGAVVSTLERREG
jgi:hypothetical protein